MSKISINSHKESQIHLDNRDKHTQLENKDCDYNFKSSLSFFNNSNINNSVILKEYTSDSSNEDDLLDSCIEDYGNNLKEKQKKSKEEGIVKNIQRSNLIKSNIDKKLRKYQEKEEILGNSKLHERLTQKPSSKYKKYNENNKIIKDLNNTS